MNTNLHLTRYQPDGKINIKRGNKFRDVIAPLFAKPKGYGVEYALRRKRIKYYQVILCPRQTVCVLDLGETSGIGDVGEEMYNKICRRYKGVVREK